MNCSLYEIVDSGQTHSTYRRFFSHFDCKNLECYWEECSYLGEGTIGKLRFSENSSERINKNLSPYGKNYKSIAFITYNGKGIIISNKCGSKGKKGFRPVKLKGFKELWGQK